MAAVRAAGLVEMHLRGLDWVLDLGESVVEAIAKLVGGVLVVGPSLAGDDHAGRGHAGKTGESDELPGQAHGFRVG